MQDMRMTPRQILCAAALALLAAAPVHAQEVDANMAIPFYNTAHAVQGLYGQWFSPQAKAAQESAPQDYTKAKEQLEVARRMAGGRS